MSGWQVGGARHGIASHCDIAFDWIRQMVDAGYDDFSMRLNKDSGYWEVSARTQFTRETHPFGVEYWDMMHEELPFAKKFLDMQTSTASKEEVTHD